MAEAERIEPREAREHVTNGDAILVCAYDDVDKCNRMKLEGAIHFGEIKQRKPELDTDQEIIFYCA